MEDKEFKRKIIKISTIFTILVIIILGFDKIKWLSEVLLGALSPFLIGIFIAILLNIPVRFLENKVLRFKGKFLIKLKRPLSIIISCLFVCCLVGLICLLIIPKVTDTFGEMMIEIPRFLRNTIETLEKNINIPEKIQKTLSEFKEASISWNGLAQYASQFITIEDGKNAVDSTFSIITKLFGSTVNLIISLIFGLSVLFEKERIINYFYKLTKTFMSQPTRKKFHHFINLFHSNFEDFFFGQCLESFIIATIFTILTSILEFECSIVVGIAMAFLALIPYIGNFVACGFGVILTVAMESPMRAIWFVVLFMVVQFLDAYLIYPRVIGIKVRMPSILIFMSALVGGSLFGLPGMFLMIPIVTTVYMMLKEKMIRTGVEGLDGKLIEDNNSKETVFEKKVEKNTQKENETKNIKQTLPQKQNHLQQNRNKNKNQKRK